MGTRISAAAPEKNPGPPARQSAVRGEDLFYISMCSGGAIIKISADRALARWRAGILLRRRGRYPCPHDDPPSESRSLTSKRKWVICASGSILTMSGQSEDHLSLPPDVHWSAERTRSEMSGTSWTRIAHRDL